MLRPTSIQGVKPALTPRPRLPGHVQVVAPGSGIGLLTCSPVPMAGRVPATSGKPPSAALSWKDLSGRGRPWLGEMPLRGSLSGSKPPPQKQPESWETRHNKAAQDLLISRPRLQNP